jgi:hypothetical protein
MLGHMYLQACGTPLAGENQRSFFFGAFHVEPGPAWLIFFFDDAGLWSHASAPVHVHPAKEKGTMD